MTTFIVTANKASDLYNKINSRFVFRSLENVMLSESRGNAVVVSRETEPGYQLILLPQECNNNKKNILNVVRELARLPRKIENENTYLILHRNDIDKKMGRGHRCDADFEEYSEKIWYFTSESGLDATYNCMLNATNKTGYFTELLRELQKPLNKPSK